MCNVSKIEGKVCKECGSIKKVKVSVFIVCDEIMDDIKKEKNVEILFDKVKIIEKGE